MRSIAPNCAGLIESFDTQANYGMSAIVGPLTLSDAVFDRAQQVARAYKEFRIKKIQVFINFGFNTFSPNMAGGSVRPRWWLAYDPKREIPSNFNKGLLEDMGVKPRAAVGLQRVTFVPRVLMPQAEVVGAIGTASYIPSASRRRPWLPCNRSAGYQPFGAFLPSQVGHYGLKWYVEDPVSPAANQPINVQIRVHFQFRRPVWYATSSEEATVIAPSMLRGVLPAVDVEDEDEADLTVEGEGEPLPPPEGGTSITPTSAKI